MHCTHCGNPLPDGARFCTNCGTPVVVEQTTVEVNPPAPQPVAPAPQAPVAVQPAVPTTQPVPSVQPAVPTAEPAKTTNGFGVAGFVLALLSLFVSSVPVLGNVAWVCGLVFSIVGMTRQPKGFAIAGLVLSLIGIILTLVLCTAAVGTVGLLAASYA